jgi:hypothetical protein
MVAGENGVGQTGIDMSELGFTIAGVAAIFGVPQAIGFLASRPFRSRLSRQWAWAIAAGLSFACGWWMFWGNPFHQHATETAHRTCGAAGALLILGLFVVAPINTAIGGAAAGILELFRNRPTRPESGPSEKSRNPKV